MDNILLSYKNGEIDISRAKELLAEAAFDDLGYAVVDHQRFLRCGHHEIIFGAGKSAAQISGIISNMLERKVPRILATRIDAAKYAEIALCVPQCGYFPEAGLLTVETEAAERSGGNVLVVTAGTSDISVAEEAAVTLAFLGHNAKRVYDVGVAGLPRLLARLDEIRRADVIIVIAGMEGALASVVGGLTDRPLIAVPTSVGYGASLGGISALLSMLNSCASGVGVVNIDNGFGAAMLAHNILGLRGRGSAQE
jgi:NCAIR mutase (PurE)-related protein